MKSAAETIDIKIPPKLLGYGLTVSRNGKSMKPYHDVFRSLGVTPMSVQTSEAALAYLRLLVFDFVLMDQESWENEGASFVKGTMELQQKTPILAIVRRQDLKGKEKALELGAWDCLLEPSSSPEMEDVIYGILSKRQAKEFPPLDTRATSSMGISGREEE